MSKKGNSRKSKRQHRKKSLGNIVMLFGGVLLLLAGVMPAVLKSGGAGKSTAIEVQGQPAIKVDQEVIDYGNVKLNQSKEFSIKVTNVGDQTLRFTQAPYVEVVEGC